MYFKWHNCIYIPVQFIYVRLINDSSFFVKDSLKCGKKYLKFVIKQYIRECPCGWWHRETISNKQLRGIGTNSVLHIIVALIQNKQVKKNKTPTFNRINYAYNFKNVSRLFTKVRRCMFVCWSHSAQRCCCITSQIHTVFYLLLLKLCAVASYYSTQLVQRCCRSYSVHAQRFPSCH